MELSGRLQELQNEVNCMNDSKDFQDAESIRSGNSPTHIWSRVVRVVFVRQFVHLATLFLRATVSNMFLRNFSSRMNRS